MGSIRNSEVLRRLTGGSLGVLFLLLTLGSYYLDFHLWLCGPGVDCLLVHERPGAAEEPESEDPRPKRPDPLTPFCQNGFYFVIGISSWEPERNPPEDLSLRHRNFFKQGETYFGVSPRSPPASV